MHLLTIELRDIPALVYFLHYDGRVPSHPDSNRCPCSPSPLCLRSRTIPAAACEQGLKFTASPSCRLPFYRLRFSMPDRLSCSKNRTPPGTRGKSGMQSISLSSSQNTSFLLPVSEAPSSSFTAIRTVPESFVGCSALPLIDLPRQRAGIRVIGAVSGTVFDTGSPAADCEV